MSRKALNQIDTSDVSEITIVDQSGNDETSGSLIGVEKDGHELTIWIDSTIQ